MKRAQEAELEMVESDVSKKRTVLFSTFQKWKSQLHKEYQTLSWLECKASTSTAGKSIVDQLKCKVCTKFKDHIRGKRNYSDRWIEGAGLLRLSNIKDHAKADQHTHAMGFLRESRHRLLVLVFWLMLPL